MAFSEKQKQRIADASKKNAILLAEKLKKGERFINDEFYYGPNGPKGKKKKETKKETKIKPLRGHTKDNIVEF